MLRIRLLLGSLFIALVVGLVYADAWLAEAPVVRPCSCMAWLGLRGCGGALILIVLGVLVVLGTRELHHLFAAAGHAPLLAWPIMVNLGLLLIVFYAANVGNCGLLGAGACSHLSADTGVGRYSASPHAVTIGWLTIGLMGTAGFVAGRRRTEGAIGAIAATLLIIVYLGLLPQYLLRLRYAHAAAGPWLLLYFLGVVKFCDIGAYFAGRAIGRHKLIEWLSPKKTIEGLVGGVAASVLLAVLVPALVRRFAPMTAIADVLPDMARAVVFGVAMALVGQTGDLLESLFKRDARRKDSADMIPAFGGVLDILDSPLLAAPVACWILLQSPA
jgi:phosphatidate cytidylyltransferase